jgi:hypothetical protein
MGDAFDGAIIFNLELHLKELKPSKLFPICQLWASQNFAWMGIA